MEDVTGQGKGKMWASLVLLGRQQRRAPVV